MPEETTGQKGTALPWRERRLAGIPLVRWLDAAGDVLAAVWLLLALVTPWVRPPMPPGAIAFAEFLIVHASAITAGVLVEGRPRRERARTLVLCTALYMVFAVLLSVGSRSLWLPIAISLLLANRLQALITRRSELVDARQFLLPYQWSVVYIVPAFVLLVLPIGEMLPPAFAAYPLAVALIGYFAAQGISGLVGYPGATRRTRRLGEPSRNRPKLSNDDANSDRMKPPGWRPRHQRKRRGSPGRP